MNIKAYGYISPNYDHLEQSRFFIEWCAKRGYEYVSDVYKIINVKESLDFLNTLHIVGFDTETEGLNPFNKKLLSIQLGTFDYQIVWDCTTVNPNLLKPILENPKINKISSCP